MLSVQQIPKGCDKSQVCPFLEDAGDREGGGKPPTVQVTQEVFVGIWQFTTGTPLDLEGLVPALLLVWSL